MPAPPTGADASARRIRAFATLPGAHMLLRRINVQGGTVRSLSPTAGGGAAALPRVRGIWDWVPKGRSLPVSDWQPRHRWLVTLLWAHVVALPIFALLRGYPNLHVVLEVGAIAVAAAAASLPSLSHRIRAAVAALGFVTASALLVHFSGGYIEAHFHFFVVIILLTLYEDWIPFLIAFGYVVFHHGVVGAVAPEAVYNHPDAIAHPWKWALIHGAFVSAAGLGGIIAWRLNEMTRARAGEAIAHAVQSQEANELKNRFLATTSHELRTPLTSIGGFAATLLHRWDDLGEREKLDALTIIDAQSSRLTQLIDELLLLSSIESGQMRVARTEIDVSATLAQIVREFRSDGDVVLRAPPRLLACLDERYFTQIVVNYLTNAQKYGSPPIEVSVSIGDRWFELTVADQGPGVPEQFVSELFEPFSRAREHLSVHGSGLGLSIVRGLAQAQGGYAWYERNHPRGARFRVRFPRVTAAELRVAAREAEPAVA